MNHAKSNAMQSDPPEQYLSPEQRLDMVADLLATIALRVLKSRHGQDQTSETQQ
jgi:hypothetical protein